MHDSNKQHKFMHANEFPHTHLKPMHKRHGNKNCKHYEIYSRHSAKKMAGGGKK